MREIKRRMETFSFYDHTGIGAHLEAMAAKGWMLERMSSWCWRYRRVEPLKLHFSIVYFPSSSEFDPEPSPEQRSFQDFCREAGWEPVAGLAQMQVFCNRGEDPLPIETDAAVQVENLHHAMKRNFLPSQILLLLIALLNAALLAKRLWDDPIGVLGSNANLFTGFCWALVVCICLVEIIGYLAWYRRAKGAARDRGDFVATRSHRGFQGFCLCLLGAGLLLWLSGMGRRWEVAAALLGMGYMCLLLLLVSGLKAFLKRRRASKTVNRAITLAACFLLAFGFMGLLTRFSLNLSQSGYFRERQPAATYEYSGRSWEAYGDALPLYVQDLREAESAAYSYYLEPANSLLLRGFTAYQNTRLDADGELPELEYSLSVIKLPALYGLCRSQLLSAYEDWDGYRYIAQDPAPWGAEEAYRLYEGSDPRGRYLVLWEDRILEIRFSWEPTPKQMAIAAKKLREA